MDLFENKFTFIFIAHILNSLRFKVLLPFYGRQIIGHRCLSQKLNFNFVNY